MNKSILSAVVLTALASSTAMAATTNTYFGAELGGKIATGDQNYDVNYDNMVKVGGDVKVKYNEAITFTAGGEARYLYGGLSGGEAEKNGAEVNTSTKVERMTIGMDTAFGSTTFGAQNNMADDMKDFGDLSAEYGYDGGFEDTKFGTQTLMQKFATDKLSVAGSYDIDSKNAVLGGTYDLGTVKVGALYAHGGTTDEVLNSTNTFRLGAESHFGKVGVAASYTLMDTDDKTKESNNAYAVSANYALTDAVTLSTSYNIVENNNLDSDIMGTVDDKDQYATIGAAYQLNKHVELKTDYKVGSNHDDQLFLRANVNF